MVNKFGNLLQKSNISCDLFCEHLEESPYSFEWDGDVKLTLKGKATFKNILSSDFCLTKQGNIQLLSPKITQEEFNLFVAACAGYVSQSEFDSFFKVV
jgi:hypothetical protein